MRPLVLAVLALSLGPAAFVACNGSSGSGSDAGGGGGGGDATFDGGAGGGDGGGGGGDATTGDGGMDSGKDGATDAAKDAEGGLLDAEPNTDDGSSDDGEPPDADMDAGTCVMTVSGAGDFPCNAGLIYSPSGTITGTWLAVASLPGSNGPSFSVELSAADSLHTGSYPMASTVSANSAYATSTGQAYVLCYNSPASNCGDQGTFSVDVDDTGTEVAASSGNAWLGAFGNVTATLPCASGDTLCSGSSVDLTIHWVTPDHGDGGPPDASTDGGDDSGDDGDCTVTFSGAVTGTQPCEQGNWTYASAANISTQTISLLASPDAGPGQGSVTTALTGPLQTTTYSNAASTSVLGESATLTLPPNDAGVPPEWTQSFSASGTTGTFSETITTTGAQQNNVAGWIYIGAQGSFTATLQPVAGSGATGTVTMTINY